jgi:HNH endonuclease
VAHAKHQEVRQRFGHRCGCCGVSEIDAGGDLTIDHYHPVTAGGDDSDDNLIYCCFKCNQYKGEFVPSQPELAHGRRILHPLRDPVALHVREIEETGLLEPLSETGRFHITLLQLNRPALVQHRLAHRLVGMLNEQQRFLEEGIAQLRAIIAAQENHIRRLRHGPGLPRPGPG